MKAFRRSFHKASGLIRYGVLTEVTYLGSDQPPVELVSSAIAAAAAGQISQLTVSWSARDLLAISGTIAAPGPVEAVSVFNEALLQALISTGQGEEFDLARRNISAAPAEGQ